MSRTNFNWRPEYTRLAAHVTGSGRADIVGFGPDGVWVSRNNRDRTLEAATCALPGLGSNDGWRADQHPRYLADLTGDGRADIVGFGNDGVWVALNNGDGGFRAARLALGDLGVNSGWRVDQHPRYLADLTGKGRADIVGFGNDGVWVALNNGDGTFQSARFVLAELGFNQGWRVEQHPRYLADLTGKGRADIVGFGNDGIWVALNNGDGTFQPARFVLAELGSNQGWRVDQHPRYLADLTGKGRADIVGFGNDGVWVALNNGDGWFGPAKLVLGNLGHRDGWRVDEHPRVLADLTGEGRADIVGFGHEGVWLSSNLGGGEFSEAKLASKEFGRNSNRDLVIQDEVVRDHRGKKIEHVFVLMLENRSFDHMLGFSAITGTDISTGEPTNVDGVKPTDGNSFNGTRFTVQTGAPDVMEGPRHAFIDVVEQLCGPGAAQPRGGPYPELNNSGFVASFAKNHSAAPEEVMKCFGPGELPVLQTLAREFLICDRWFSSVPGPTSPNRMFTHAATSREFDDSPGVDQQGTAGALPDVPIVEDVVAGALRIFGIETEFGGFEFSGGNIFNCLEKAGRKFRIYSDDPLPDVSTMDGVSIVSDIREFNELAVDLRDSSFDASYVFIEPNYDWIDGTYADGNSQHPRGSVAAGERFIKATYEAIRNSPLWAKSLLIITWDEHGGYYDHVAPGPATPTGFTGRHHGFMFDQLGPRVPAVVVSPLIRKNAISHLRLEHASIVQTLIDVFDLPPLQQSRVAHRRVNGLGHFATLPTPRTDAPRTLPAARASAVTARRISFRDSISSAPDAPITDDPDRVLAMTLAKVVNHHLQLEPGRRLEILAREREIRTRSQLLAYAKEVNDMVRARRARRHP